MNQAQDEKQSVTDQQVIDILQLIRQHGLTNPGFISLIQKDINLVANIVKTLRRSQPDEVKKAVSNLNSLIGLARWSTDFKKGLNMVFCLLDQTSQPDSVRINSIQCELAKSIYGIPILYDMTNLFMEKVQLTEPITIGFVIDDCVWRPDPFLESKILRS